MATGSKVATKHRTMMNKVQLKKKSLDESDEDYMAGEDYDDEFDESEDEYCYSLAVDGTDESLREFEEEERTKKVKRVGGPRGQRSSRGRNGIVELRKKNAAYCAENGGLKGRKKGIHGGKKGVFGGELRMRTPDSSAKRKADHSNEKPRKETNVLCREEGEDNDWNDSDEEIRPDEVGGDEELTVMKKNKVTRLTAQAAQGAKRENKKRKLKNLKRTIRKKPKKECAVEESRDEGSVAQKTKRGRGNGEGMGKLNVRSGSDSDSVSGFSGYEYTISEEEREQIREAKEICKSLTTDLRSSYLKTIKGEETVPWQQKRPETKEKEEMVDRKMKVGKQVCGICLSEEGKRPVRGILNCCSHYFCFACIIEWSKVESRCPLCKQRFETIRRTAQVVGEHGSRDVTIPVPECDQVYQPSVEELRGYLDPYENVLCTECHHGGDDALMLLCDLCDSSAHTYCVGLGHEVPEGNWYCVVCTTTVLDSSNSQALPSPHHRANTNLSVGSSPVISTRETYDPNELYVPDTPYYQPALLSVPPRYYVGVSRAASPAFGSVALTVSERRRIQQQIHHRIRVLNNRSQQSERSDTMAPVAGICEDVPLHRTPQSIRERGNLPYYGTPSLYGREVYSPLSISRSSQVVQHQASTSTTVRTCHGMDHYQQFHPCNSISNTRGVRPSCPLKEHVQSMVKNHLKSLSRDSDLGYVTFKKVARRSTHTVLAAFGVEHRRNEVNRVQTRPLLCNHIIDTQKWEVAGQCCSCLDWFIRSVVREIMSIPNLLLE